MNIPPWPNIAEEQDQDDPDALRAQFAAERNHPLYWAKVTLEEIQVQMTYGMASLKLIGWLVVLLLGLILWRLW